MHLVAIVRQLLCFAFDLCLTQTLTLLCCIWQRVLPRSKTIQSSTIPFYRQVMSSQFQQVCYLHEIIKHPVVVLPRYENLHFLINLLYLSRILELCWNFLFQLNLPQIIIQDASLILGTMVKCYSVLNVEILFLQLTYHNFVVNTIRLSNCYHGWHIMMAQVAGTLVWGHSIEAIVAAWYCTVLIFGLSPFLIFCDFIAATSDTVSFSHY